MMTVVSVPAVGEIAAPFDRKLTLLDGSAAGPRGPAGPRSKVPRLKSTPWSEWLMTCFVPTLLAGNRVTA
jgi:hypothetical protein